MVGWSVNHSVNHSINLTHLYGYMASFCQKKSSTKFYLVLTIRTTVTRQLHTSTRHLLLLFTTRELRRTCHQNPLPAGCETDTSVVNHSRPTTSITHAVPSPARSKLAAARVGPHLMQNTQIMLLQKIRHTSLHTCICNGNQLVTELRSITDVVGEQIPHTFGFHSTGWHFHRNSTLGQSSKVNFWELLWQQVYIYRPDALPVA